MNGHPRLSRRKKQILSFLKESNPLGIATLNELRVRAMWADNGVIGSRSHADHKKSFNRTLLEHGEPFDVLDLSRTWQGAPIVLTVGIFARWTVWELIERGFLSTTPKIKNFELYMGHDACTAIIRNTVTNYAVIGNCCFLNSLYLVAKPFAEEMLDEISEVPWSIFDGEQKKIHCRTPIHKLSRLPNEIALDGGRNLSMSKIKPGKY